MRIESKDPAEGERYACPYCGGLIVIFHAPLSLGHALPVCGDFVVAKTEDFLVAIVKARAQLN